MAIFSIILRLVLICFCCFYIYYLINELLIYIARLKTKVAQQRKLIEECDRFIQSLKKK